jgi:nucleoside phosphorylase
MTDSVDFLVVTMIPELEFKALSEEISSHFSGRAFKRRDISTDVRWFEFQVQNGELYTVIVSTIIDQGNVASAAMTASLINRFKPGFTCLFGIAGNVDEEKAKRGDVIIATQVVYKVISKVKDEKYMFEQPSIPSLDRSTWRKIQEMGILQDVDLSSGNPEYTAAAIANRRAPSVGFERIYCSDLVVDCAVYRDQQIKGVDRHLRAIEMEAAGFLRAVSNYQKDSKMFVPTVIVRGISDNSAGKQDSDGDKSVNWREFAASNAAKVLCKIIDKVDDSYWVEPA